MRPLIYIITLLLMMVSCKQSEREKLTNIVSEWNNKEILFPSDTAFMYHNLSSLQKINMKHNKFTILNYVDSIGCISCKLQLLKWDEFIYLIDSVSGGDVPCLFVFHPSSKKDLIKLLKRKRFNYPVYIDENDAFNKLNHFPTNIDFQSFLLDENSKVLVVGNPILNPHIKKLYLNIIQGEKVVSNDDNKVCTEVSVKDANIALGRFDWQKEQKIVFTLKNVGDNLLLIEDVTTSCGCTTVTYSKEPVRSGQTVSLNVMYKAEQPEHFDKTITVYCNAKSSPVVLRITGDAE